MNPNKKEKIVVEIKKNKRSMKNKRQRAKIQLLKKNKFVKRVAKR